MSGYGAQGVALWSEGWIVGGKFGGIVGILVMVLVGRGDLMFKCVSRGNTTVFGLSVCTGAAVGGLRSI